MTWKDQEDADFDIDLEDLPISRLAPEQDTTPRGTTDARPLALVLTRDDLRTMIEGSLDSIRVVRRTVDTNLEIFHETEQLLVQRLAARRWLARDDDSPPTWMDAGTPLAIWISKETILDRLPRRATRQHRQFVAWLEEYPLLHVYANLTRDPAGQPADGVAVLLVPQRVGKS